MFSDSLHDIDHSRWFEFSRNLFCLSLFLLRFLISVMIFVTPEIAIAQDQETTANEESKDKINYLLTQTLRLGENRVREAFFSADSMPVSYTHLRAHETPEHLVCRLLLEKKKK